MNSLSVVQIAVEGFDDNFSYLIVDGETKQAALVDPCGKIERVFSEVKKQELVLSSVLITHSHLDHLERLDDVIARYSVTVYIHESAQGHIAIPNALASYTKRDGTIAVGKGDITVLHTPGHIGDAVCYYIPVEQAQDGVPKLITGDTVFVEGCGRTNEAGVKALYDSLQFIKTLPDETEVYPGHDYGSVPISTIGQEKENNKYFRAENFEEFKKIRLKL